MDDEIILKYNQYEKSFTPRTMEVETNLADKIYEACTIGREKNIIANNYKIISVLLKGENLKLDIKFNEEILRSIFNSLDEEWEEKFVDNSYYIENDKLIIVNGKKRSSNKRRSFKRRDNKSDTR